MWHQSSGIFDIGDPDGLFHSIQGVYRRYKAARAKSTEDLLYIIMALNHLREWIAPRFDPQRDVASNGAEKFFCEIFQTDDFKMINALCNATKHFSDTKPSMTSLHDLTLDEYPDIDSLQDFDKGPPSAHAVNGKSVELIVESVIDFYSKNWFESPNRVS